MGIIPRESVHQLVTESEKDGLGCRGQVHAKCRGSSDKFKLMRMSKAQDLPLNSPTPKVHLGSPILLETLSQPTSADKVASSGKDHVSFFLWDRPCLFLSLGPRIFEAVEVTTILPLSRDSEQVTQSCLQPLQV